MYIGGGGWFVGSFFEKKNGTIVFYWTIFSNEFIYYQDLNNFSEHFFFIVKYEKTLMRLGFWKFLLKIFVEFF